MVHLSAVVLKRGSGAFERVLSNLWICQMETEKTFLSGLALRQRAPTGRRSAFVGSRTIENACRGNV